jgi:Domain of unknown function (DUF4276)
MTRLWIAPVVEGHGEKACIRLLLERIWYEMLGGEFVRVVRPVLQPRGNLVKQEGLHRAVKLAIKNLSDLPESDDPKLVLILIDADEDCPREWGPKLLDIAREVDSRMDVACVLAKVEYETWFAAAAESLTKYLEFPPDFVAADSPEEEGHAKAWVERYFRGHKYIEPQDQPAMTSAMDLAVCRRRSPSFDKLCRELERRLRRVERSG